MPTEIYCMRCHKKFFVIKPHPETLKNGTRVIAGECPKCGSKCNKIVKGPDFGYKRPPLTW